VHPIFVWGAEKIRGRKNPGIVDEDIELALRLDQRITAGGGRDICRDTAQLAISRGLAKLTRGTGVTVNSVLPGPTMSEGVEEFVKDLARQGGESEQEAAANFIKQHRSSSLLQRFASVDEIANMVVYAASKESSATNGAALRAEGGIVDTIA